MGCLYKLTSPSGKSYIGITSKTLDKRWAKHVEHALGKRDSGALYAALRKYGPDSFYRESLIECDDWDELCRLEIEHIAKLGTFAPGGYNLTTGGEGIQGPRSELVKQKISVAQKKRFSNPTERDKLLENSAKGRLALAEKRRLNPPIPKPPKPRLSKEERSRRTREGMSKPGVAEKVRECARQRAANPEWRAKVSASKKGKPGFVKSPELCKKISEARKREWADPVTRERRLTGLVKARAAKGTKLAQRTLDNSQ